MSVQRHDPKPQNDLKTQNDVKTQNDLKTQSTLPRCHFSLNTLPERERYDAWRDSVSCIFKVEASRDVRQSAFEAEIEAVVIGPLVMAHTMTLEQEWRRTPDIMARDGMDHYMVQLYETGDMYWEDKDGQLLQFPEHGLVVFDLTRPSLSQTIRFTNLSLFIPRFILEPKLKNPDSHHLRALPGHAPLVQLLRSHMQTLYEVSHSIGLQEAVDLASPTVGLVAACLNYGHGDQNDPDMTMGIALAQMTQARRYIEANLSNPGLSSNWIAKQLGVSRTKLFSIFSAYGGVAKYTRDRRMRKALLLLGQAGAENMGLINIADMCGYASDTAFSRVFKDHYGIPPSEIKSAVSNLPVDPVEGPVLDRRYERWIRHLSL